MKSHSRPWLWASLAITLVATAWVSVGSNQAALPDSAMPVARLVSAVAASASTPALAVAPANSRAEVNPAAREYPKAWPKPTAQGLLAWSPPPAPPPAPAPRAPPPDPVSPPPPQAPPFPYQLIGRLQQGDVPLALLNGAVRTLAVAAGDIVDTQWRVDKVEASALHVTWLPGGLSQRVSYGPNR